MNQTPLNRSHDCLLNQVAYTLLGETTLSKVHASTKPNSAPKLVYKFYFQT